MEIKNVNLHCGCVIVRELADDEIAPTWVRDGSTPPRRFEVDTTNCTQKSRIAVVGA
jgi:hypothetical protein